MISGTLGADTITDGRLRGEQIEFKAGGKSYTGRVNGNSIKGSIDGGGSWTATKG
jgi:hypothetical protein